MTQTNNEKVREFYEKFQQTEFIPDPTKTKPSLNEETISEDRLHLKMNLIIEEATELVEAVYGKKSSDIMIEAWEKAKKEDEHNRDIIEAADATGDLRYVIEGFDIETGIPSEQIFNEIHNSNLSKLDEQGNPIISDGKTPSEYDGKIKPKGKILKSKNFYDPNIKKIIEEQ